MIAILFSLASLASTMVVLSAPFCFLQLALFKFCPIRAVHLAPPVLFSAGFLWGWRYLDCHYNWDALLGILIMFPCILGLIGSGAGWFLWKKRLR